MKNKSVPFLSNFQRVYLRHLLTILLVITVMLGQLGCVQLPSHSALQADKFGNDQIAAKRFSVIVNMEGAEALRIGHPLLQKIATLLKKQGYTVSLETQIKNPLTLGSDIDFRGAHGFAADAILLIRASAMHWSSNQGFDITLTFDLLNSEKKGIWRGTARVYRLHDIDSTADDLARQVIEDLKNGGLLGDIQVGSSNDLRGI